MTLHPLFGLALFAGLFSTSAIAAEAIGGANVRSGPGAGYQVVDTLASGENVTVTECATNGWCMISHSGPDGWVSANYLTGGAYEAAPVYEEPPDIYYAPPPTIYVTPPFYHHHRHHMYNWPGKPGTWPHPPGNNHPGNWQPPGGNPNPPDMHPPGDWKPGNHPHPNGGGNFCQMNPTICQNHHRQH